MYHIFHYNTCISMVNLILHNDLQQLEEEKQGHGTMMSISNGRGHV